MICRTGVMINNNKKNKQTFSLWLIGPSASGKTTISKIVYKKLLEKYKSLAQLQKHLKSFNFFKPIRPSTFLMGCFIFLFPE